MSHQRQLFYQHLAQTSPFPLALEITHAEGIYLYDSEGKCYIDLISGIAVSNVGHRHPAVIQAIENQIQKYLHLMVYGELVLSPQVKLAKKLTETLPPALDQVYLVNSGTEATEGAMKLAKRYTGKTKVFSCFQSYHGASQGALSLAGSEGFKNAFRPLLPEIYHFQFGNFEDIKKIDSKTAAVFIEIIQGEAGVKKAPPGYFQALQAQCQNVGALLVVDEIQSGFGRTGTFWAFEQEGIVPDILLTAKGMGGGMPIGAFISRKEIMSSFMSEPILGHITTFGGHPVSSAAALACAEVILDSDVLSQVTHKGNLFKSLLKHPAIHEVRGQGLLMAIELGSFQEVLNVIKEGLALGLLTDWFLFCDTALRLAPPLTITEEEIKKAADLLLQAISQAQKK